MSIKSLPIAKGNIMVTEPMVHCFKNCNIYVEYIKYYKLGISGNIIKKCCIKLLLKAEFNRSAATSQPELIASIPDNACDFTRHATARFRSTAEEALNSANNTLQVYFLQKPHQAAQSR